MSCRQNYHQDCEAAINKQINMELYASYLYQSIAYYFDREDVDLKGFHKFFKKSSDEEREHAEKFMKYQNQRGGSIKLQDVKGPSKDEWGNGMEAMKTALDLERRVNESLLELHGVAGKHNDAHLSDFLEGEFLTEQVESIKEISGFITRLKLAGPGLGEYMFDKDLQ